MVLRHTNEYINDLYARLAVFLLYYVTGPEGQEGLERITVNEAGMDSTVILRVKDEDNTQRADAVRECGDVSGMLVLSTWYSEDGYTVTLRPEEFCRLRLEQMRHATLHTIHNIHPDVGGRCLREVLAHPVMREWFYTCKK